MMTVNSGYDKAFGKAYQAPSYGAVTPFNMQPQQQSIMPVRGYQTPPQYGGAQPAAWEVAEFGGSPLYGNYNQALPTANSMNAADYKSNGSMNPDLSYDPATGAIKHTLKNGRYFYTALSQGAGAKNRADALQKEAEAKALKEKLAGASPISTAPVPVFGNTRQKDVGYWGIRGY